MEARKYYCNDQRRHCLDMNRDVLFGAGEGGVVIEKGFESLC